MGPRLTLHVPASVTTRYLVATDDRATPDAGYLRDALPRTALARVARDLLGTPLLTVAPGLDAPTRWSERLGTLGGAADALERVAAATRHVVVTATAAPAAQPRHAQAARLAVRALAAATGGAVVDLDANQVLPPRPAEPERFVLGQEWTGVFLSLDGQGDGSLVRAETCGMHRFGLPELAAARVPYAHMLTSANLMRALAHRMLAEHLVWLAAGPPSGPRTVPARCRATGDDVLRFWGARPEGRPGLSVDLVRTPAGCPGCDAALEAVPPDNAGTAWWDDHAATALPKILWADPSP
ncbi:MULTISPECIES: hypothetical protein [Actinomadura]|uniref:Uncharacterized protein n=1 Tax=Actinomadura yumaensis TaxID=111807 RepID=A0ABW2CZK1_9ACTN|nr:hypothetical protein [Actinomadura sp. J1-007]MWK39447.1 hypothetical protein [Actinomadura sp. J1-007]